MARQPESSPFVSLPTRVGAALRILGPPPAQAAVAVDPLVRIDESVGVVQAFVAGLCDRDGGLVQPMEVLFALDPAHVGPVKEVPAAAPLVALRDLFAATPAAQSDGTALSSIYGDTGAVGPLLYCRKRHVVFAARSPNTAELLRAVPAAEEGDPATARDGQLPPALLSWDGADNESPAIYGGAGGESAAGEARSLEQLVFDQGGVVARATALAEEDPAAADRLAREHVCCACPERKRCFPAGGGYAYALDRLVIANAAESPVAARPLGEWRLGEVARMLGGVSPREVVGEAGGEENAFETWKRERAGVIETFGPPLLLAGEADGRYLLEIARLKLGLAADTLEQLDACWRATGRPHLCWNDETVRPTWRAPTPAPAAYWGFRPLLRKVGLQPLSAIKNCDEKRVPCPPAFSDEGLLAPEVQEAMRYFGQPRTAGVYVKSAKSAGDDRADVHVLLEDLGIARGVFCREDCVKLNGEGWEAWLKPVQEHDPDDGEGVPFAGSAIGKVGGWKEAESIAGCTCVWYPYFGEAVDLYAVGRLLFETLIAHDEREVERFRDEIVVDCEELTKTCAGLPLEQRDEQARAWIATRCEVDTPAALWTRRKLLYRAEERAAVELDRFPMNLWKAIVTCGFRFITWIPGFSYCDDRSLAAPRIAGAQLLPLVELRGLLALLDDLIFGRKSPGESLRGALESK